MTTNAVVTYEAMPLPDRMQYANTIAGAASMLPNGIRAGGPDQIAANAFLIMETGAMLDLHPIAALSSVNIIEGKPALSADLMVSVVRNAGHTVRISEEGTIEGGDYKATVTVIRADDPDYPVTSVWTPQRAARAGLCQYAMDAKTGQWAVSAMSQKGYPLPWQQYTEALCKARAKSEACRDGAGDSLNGARYTPEELGAQVDAAGNPIVTTLGAVEEVGEVVVAEEAKPSALPKQTKRATTGRQGAKRKTAAKVEEPAEEVAEVVAEVVPEPAVQPEPQPTAEDEERAERERIANEQMRQVSEREAAIATAANVDRADEAAVAAWNAEHGKATGHYITSDAEVQRQREKMNAEEPAAAPEPVEDEGPQWVDRDGTVYDSQAELDAAIRARVQGSIATDAGQVVGTIDANAKTFAEVVAEEPKNYAAQLAVATTQEECLAVWNAAQADDENPVTTEFKMEILRVKNSLTGDQA